jgi:hypothetical protein
MTERPADDSDDASIGSDVDHAVFRAGSERVEVTGESTPRPPYGPESGRVTDSEPADDPNRNAPDAAGMSAGGPDGRPLRDSDAAPTHNGG